MYSPVGLTGDAVPAPDTGTGAAALASAGSFGPGAMAAAEPIGARPSSEGDFTLQALTDGPPDLFVTERGVVPVPPLTALCIGICVAFSVVFGIIPGPIVDFAHQATLLFI
jgi:hypothetical protein